MKSTTFIVTTLVALALLVGACAPASTPAPTQVPPTQAPAAASAGSSGSSMPSDTPTAAAMAEAAMVNVGSSAKYSSFLVDGKGMTLYLYTKDTPGTTTCYDKCATAWPPLLTSGSPVAGTGVDASRFGTTKRTDGTTQVTYNGWPLYYYGKDKNPGDTTGQDVGKVWYLISPSGDKVASSG
jgi:predicted lipoprotein with Yx(FWY)xxD motif